MLAVFALLSSMLGASSAEASYLRDNDYAIDLFQGPVLAPIRVIGIAGAYAGYAEGIEGLVANAATPAVREPFSVSSLDLDVAASLSVPIALFSRKKDDFDNSGGEDFDYSDFVFFTAGGLLQLGRLGFGGVAELQQYSLTEGGETTRIYVGKHHLLGAVRLVGDQFMVGAGARVATLGISAPEADLTFVGAAPEVGVLLRPDWRSFRIGATWRAPVYAASTFGGSVIENGVSKLGGLVLPSDVVLPWELELGVAVQVGPRPLNPEWLDPTNQEKTLLETFTRRRDERAAENAAALEKIEDPKAREDRKNALEVEEARVRAEERELYQRTAARMKEERRARFANWPREHLLVTAELLVSGPVEKGVSIERFLAQGRPIDPRHTPVLAPANAGSVVGSSGAEVNFSPRFGIETEPILSLVKTRFGSYYEPNRFGRVGRQHFTFGADMRVFDTTLWGLIPRVTYKVQASVDLSARYESYSLGLGVWR